MHLLVVVSARTFNDMIFCSMLEHKNDLIEGLRKAHEWTLYFVKLG